MRAGSLSNAEVIDLVSKYYVPVQFSVDDYDRQKKQKAEVEEWNRIRERAESRGYARGSVCVYLIDKGGDVLDSLLVDQAMKPDRLLPMLRRVIEQQHLQPLDAAAARKKPAKPNSKGKQEGRKVRIWTRNLGPDWSLGVSEDSVELTAEEWAAILPGTEPRVGAEWPISHKITDKLYPYFFPPMKNYDAGNSVISKASLIARVEEIDVKEIRLSLRGVLEMEHPLRAAEKPAAAGQKTNGHVSANLVGRAVFDRAKLSVRSLQVVSESASYVWHWQGNPVRSTFVLAAEFAP